MKDYEDVDELRNLDVIAQAEGVIVVRDGVTITEAAVILRAEAAANDQRVSEAARAIVHPPQESTADAGDASVSDPN